MKKRICIISHHFYPEINPRSFRTTELADELSRRGYAVDLFISGQEKMLSNYTEQDKYNLKQTSPVNSKHISKFKEYRYKILQFLIGDPNIIKKKSFFKNNVKLSEYDIVISIAHPVYTHYHVSKLIDNSNTIFIADCGDPFYGVGNTRYAFYIKLVQKNMLAKFNYITIPIVEAVEYYSEYVAKEKIKVIPQGFKIEDNVEEFKKKDEKCEFLYAGTLYKDIRSPVKLLEALSKMPHDFIFHIYTDLEGEVYENILKPYKKIMGEKLQLHNKVSRDKILNEMKKVDFVLNLENTEQLQLPSKLIDCAISKKPILSVFPENIEREKIKAFLSGDYTDALEIDISQFDIRNVVDKFEKLFFLNGE